MNATYPYPGAERFDFEGMAYFSLEQHLACDCKCKVQREHCHPTKHTYDADSCRCQCSNTSGSTECPLRKKWSERECACVCKNQYSCYDDEFFDSAACRLYITPKHNFFPPNIHKNCSTVFRKMYTVQHALNWSAPRQSLQKHSNPIF